MKKVIVACGHTASGTLGSGAADLLDESDCNREIGPLVCSYFNKQGIEAPYLRIDKGNTYNNEDCYTRANQANVIGGELYIEIHLNSGKGRTGDGTEVCISTTNTETKAIASRVSSSIASKLGIEDRGLRTSNLIVLKRTSMRAILVECMFVDTNDISNYNADLIARAIVEGVLDCTISTDLVKGWNKSEDGTKWWYCTDVEKYCYYTSSWQLIDESWYLFDDVGFCITGWKQYKDKWYYLDATSCAMKTGWFKDTDGEWYFFNNDGEMLTGEIIDNGKVYMCYSTGEMIHDCDVYGYRFASDGSATKL